MDGSGETPVAAKTTGFSQAKLIHDKASADARDIVLAAADDTVEDFGRKAAWRREGAEK